MLLIKLMIILKVSHRLLELIQAREIEIGMETESETREEEKIYYIKKV